MCYKHQPIHCEFCSKLVYLTPCRWRIWLALSEFLCLLTNQNVTFVTLFCTQLPFFCTVLPKNCIPRSQSQSRNFFMYIIKTEKQLLRLWITVNDIFFSSLSPRQAASFPSKYAIDQTRFQTNIPSSRHCHPTSGGLEPIRNGEIFWVNNNHRYCRYHRYVIDY